METPVTERLTDARFWAIVEEIGWPHVDPDAAKLLLMRAYPPSVMEAMHAAFHRACGPGYDDDWPFSAWCGHLIPNIVRNLERYRLVGDSNERAVI